MESGDCASEHTRALPQSLCVCSVATVHNQTHRISALLLLGLSQVHHRHSSCNVSPLPRSAALLSTPISRHNEHAWACAHLALHQQERRGRCRRTNSGRRAANELRPSFGSSSCFETPKAVRMLFGRTRKMYWCNQERARAHRNSILE